jgi:hypothetical protein
LLIGQGISERLLILYCTNANQIALQGDLFCRRWEKRSVLSHLQFAFKKQHGEESGVISSKCFQLEIKCYNSENELMVIKK